MIHRLLPAIECPHLTAFRAAILILGVTLAASAHAWQARISDMEGPMPEWSYSGEDGPGRWGELESAFQRCSNGRLQSPIPLSTNAARFQSCAPLRFRYRSTPLRLVNDGNALRLGYEHGSYLVIDGLSYELVELRFHVPGEHAINGRVSDGEIELIHGNNRGDIAIVSVPIEAGKRVNQTLRRILENAPLSAGKTAYGRNIGVNAVFLLPSRRSYLAYEGSLTRPPCLEGVHRYVLDNALEVDASDLARLAQIVGANARALQPVNGRRIDYLCGTAGD